MLKVPKLDDLSYEKLVQRARSRIPALSASWTDYNDHDPGITTLQTMAWLVDTLNYYIDATGEAHRLRYLRLLGLRPELAAARCLVALSLQDNTGDEAQGAQKIAVTRGAKMAAGGTVFEVAQSYRGAANRVTALFSEADGKFYDLTPVAGVDAAYATLFPDGGDDSPAAYFGFEKALAGETRFFIELQPNPARNPFDDVFRLAEFVWEFYDGAEWQEAAFTEDGTRGFLKSGFTGLSLAGGTALLDGHPHLPPAHYLRARLVGGAFDAPPRIGKLYANCVEAVQTDTHAQALELVYGGGNTLPIDYHIRAADVIRVAVENGEGYSLWFDGMPGGGSLCDIIPGDAPWRRAIRFSKRRFGVVPERGQKLLVTITDGRLDERLRLGVTTGFARERMEVALQSLCELRVATVEEKDGRPFLRLWEECDDLGGAPPDARVFQLDRAEGAITFGDGLRGEQPGPGRLVVAVTAKTSRLDAGNIRAHRIDRFLDSAYASLLPRNPVEATGGKRPKSSAELERELEAAVTKTTRAVTAADYEALVLATPGLMIDCVNVFSGAQYAAVYGGGPRPGAVLVAAKPLSEAEARPRLTEAYRSRIRESLERRRLLTADVRVLPARYVGIEADGRIVLTENTAALRRRVEEALRGLIEPLGGKRFGAGLVYGRIFSRLELLDCVAGVTELSFSCAGDGARKNEQGDIIVFPDAIAWLEKINIEFV